MSTSALKRLKQCGKDISTVPLSRFPTDQTRVVWLVVNSYTSYRLSLGDGPINDGANFGSAMKKYGYTIYYIHNPTSKKFLNYLDKFLANVTEELIVYYVGHGTTVKDLDGDEDDGYDEATVFDDATVTDDVMVEHVIKNKNPSSKLICVTDACHSGSIWDIQSGNKNGRVLPENFISVSAANDKQTAKQTMIDRKEQGIFTSNMCTYLGKKKDATPNEISSELRSALRKYAQTMTVAATTDSLLTTPLFTGTQ